MLDPRIVSVAAQSILAAARSPKRAAPAHKRQGADLMRQLDELRRLASENGIELEIEDHTDA
jgi:hypothetical protein